MAPKRVLRSPPPLPSATISVSTNGLTTGTTGNNVYSFGSSQLMDVGIAATTILVSAILRLSEKFYRTVRVANPFFRTIKELVVDFSFSSANLVVTLSTYIDMHTCSTNIKAIIAAHKMIRATVFHAEITTGFGFRIQYSTSIFYRLTKHRASHHISLTLAL